MAKELPVRIVSIEGGIGAGKSTVLNALKKTRAHFCYIDEPVQTWEDSGLLDAMYAKTIDPGCFQIAAMATRFAPLLKAVREGHKIIVTERCPWSDLEVFTKANLPEGSNELTAYQMAHDALMTAMPPYELYVIYLRASVDTLLARIETRGRPAERMRGDEGRAEMRAYLEKLQAKHDAFFHYKGSTVACAIDCELDAATVEAEVVRKVAQWAPVKVEVVER